MNAQQVAECAKTFERDGYVLLPATLSVAEVQELRHGVEEAHRHPCPTGNPTPFHRHQMFRRGAAFEQILDREPVVDVAEAVLGADCHVIANNTIFTRPGSGIDRWHVDETVVVPIPEGVTLDPRMSMPCYVVTAMYYLTDVPVELGPTQIVPGSHRSGRFPPEHEHELVWEGRGYVTIVAKAGDCLLLNGQTWHRGATNNSDTSRQVLQVTYGRRFIAQRFHPYVNVQIPTQILERADKRRRRLLGVHQHGPYG